MVVSLHHNQKRQKDMTTTNAYLDLSKIVENSYYQEGRIINSEENATILLELNKIDNDLHSNFLQYYIRNIAPLISQYKLLMLNKNRNFGLIVSDSIHQMPSYYMNNILNTFLLDICYRFNILMHLISDTLRYEMDCE